MRNSVAGIALIHCEVEGQKHWLARWNETWRAFTFIGGNKQEGESFRECLLRRVSEELGLEPDADFQVAEEPQAHWNTRRSRKAPARKPPTRSNCIRSRSWEIFRRKNRRRRRQPLAAACGN